MAARPSLKGSLITELADDINKLIADGELPRERVERQLSSEDLATLASDIAVSQWYSVGFYRRAAELLRDTVGAGRNEYLRERGVKRGRMLIDAGLYQQMEYATRPRVQGEAGPEARFAAYGRDLRLFVSLSRSLLNFSRWSAIPDPDHDMRYLILVDEAADYPDVLAWATEGLIESMASTHGLANLWSHQRTHPDRIVFRMSRPA